MVEYRSGESNTYREGGGVNDVVFFLLLWDWVCNDLALVFSVPLLMLVLLLCSVVSGNGGVEVSQ